MKHSAFVLSLVTAMMTPAQDLPRTLAGMRDHYRPLLIFTGEQTRLAEQQLTVASDHVAEFKDRQILVVGVQGSKGDVQSVLLSPSDDAACRKQFHILPGEFTVILLGKDGGEKLRSHEPIPFKLLRSTIDAMPMRQMEQRQH